MIFNKPIKKKGNKHKHISNKPIQEWMPCYICNRQAIQTHEIYYGDVYLRNTSIKYGAQITVCNDCHMQIHKSNYKNLKADFQKKLMLENNWTIEEFREKFYKNYLEV